MIKHPTDLMGKNMETTIVYWGYMEKMEKNMDTSLSSMSFRQV